MENTPINEVEAHKHLGVYVSIDCSWHQHMNYIKQKAWARISIIRRLKYSIQYDKYELDKIRNEATRIATGAIKLVPLTNLYKEIGWETLSKRRGNHKLTLN